MQRKIVKHGESTLTISLPSKWAKLNNLKNGQLLEINTQKERMIISPKDTSSQKIKISFGKEEEWFIHKILRHLYTAGYDEIDAQFEKINPLEKMRDWLSVLPGLEVVEEEKNNYKLKCLSISSESEYNNLVKNIMWAVLGQLDLFIENCLTSNGKKSAEFREKFYMISKLANLCKRLINKKNIYNASNSIYAYDFLNSLTELSLLVVYGAEYIEDKKNIIFSEDEKKLMHKTRDFYYELMMTYQILDTNRTEKFFVERQRLFEKNWALDLLKGRNAVIIHYFLIILRILTPMGNHILMLHTSTKDQK